MIIQLYFLFSGLPLIIFVIMIVVVCCALAQKECSKDKARREEGKGRPVVVTPSTPPTRRRLPSEHRVMALTCTCGKLNNPSEKKCWSCNEPLATLQPQLHTFDASRRCSVCAYYLYSEDRMAITPCCFAQGHDEHLQDWVKAKNSCPSCEEAIKPAHLLRVLPPTWRSPSRRWKPSEQEIIVLVCECGKPNHADEKVCWSCNKSLTKAKRETQKIKSAPSCIACGYEIDSSEQIAICPNCQCQGHKTHLLALIKAKGECPTCGQRLRTTHMLVSKPETTHHPRR